MVLALSVTTLVGLPKAHAGPPLQELDSSAFDFKYEMVSPATTPDGMDLGNGGNPDYLWYDGKKYGSFEYHLDLRLDGGTGDLFRFYPQ